MANVDFTIKNNLCISCGICKAVCPVGAINYEKINGQYLPQIDLTKCINCGLCLKFVLETNCLGEKYLDKSFEWHNIIGKYESCFVVQAKDEIVLRNSASGGFVSTIVFNLLKDKDYDAAYFLPNKIILMICHHYKKITTVGDVFNCAKSKYIPVSAYI
jgi:coenzyme F420 hydrogenase subunit beta